MSRRIGFISFALLGIVGCGTGPTEIVAVDGIETASESYIGAFTDRDMMLLAAGADLRGFFRARGAREADVFKEMTRTALDVYRAGVVPTPDGGWLFQPGRWADHPDYRYAGVEIKPPVTEARVADVVGDVSHFSRTPLILTSMMNGAGPESAEGAYYGQLRAGLETQFFNHVVVPPSAESHGYRLNNYMDGRNGLYRWEYNFAGKGYGPYELSGTLFWGWWGFLGTPQSRQLFQRVEAGFPYSTEDVATYLGPWLDRSGFVDGSFATMTMMSGHLGAGQARAGAAVTGRHRQVWSDHVLPRLQGEPWVGATAERVSWDMMVPLHFAFEAGVAEWQDAFAEYFTRYTETGGLDQRTHLLGRIQHLYLATRFLSLAVTSGRDDIIPTGMADLIRREVVALWTDAGEIVSSTGWGEPPFAGYRDYIAWKVATD